MNARDYKLITVQYLETIKYVKTLNTKPSERFNFDGKLGREAYIQQYEQRLAAYEIKQLKS